MKKAYKIEIKGLVQGVGFRPFIYRLAKEFDLNGWVINSNEGVTIKVQGSKSKVQSSKFKVQSSKFEIEGFISAIREQAPPASRIESIIVKGFTFSKGETYTDFQILRSTDSSDEVTEISPDIAVCGHCLSDMKIQSNRIDYPFINCTNCGPRFSIIQDLPYDREKTTMKKFIMCDDCKSEYTDVSDRRFHAQPVACLNCGPEYTLVQSVFVETQSIASVQSLKTSLINSILDLLKSGKIIAFKGIGGFHLACDATNNETVERLRELKSREGKPFAVMFSDINTLKEYAEVNEVEEKLLVSWRRPIVLLKQKKKLCESINRGLNTIGAMLPYMPFHHLLFEQLALPAIVLTSGNISDEPIVIDNDVAVNKLSKIADAILVYNRDISNRTDDSVLFVTNGQERLIRRSRGYVPNPVSLNHNVDGILATGGELKNCFCIGKGNHAIMSQHIGDIKNLETLEFYTETISKFKKLFRVEPTIVVCDKHPDYLSTKYAQESGLKLLQVQHHYAHIASVMAEHKLDEKVIGVSFDGTGFGDDGNIWGSEFFVCDLTEYKRYTHFDYVPMPGGDKASEEPWRMAVSYLYRIYGKELLNLKLPFIKELKSEDINIMLAAIDNKINCPLTSGAGRLFDAVSAIINLCLVSTFEAEAPIRLESIIDESCVAHYIYNIGNTIFFNDAIREIVSDLKASVPLSVISAKFHNTIILVIFDVIKRIQSETNINKVVLSGGSFQNRYILKNIENVLAKNNYHVYINNLVPANDGGLALGQLAIAAKQREKEF